MRSTQRSLRQGHRPRSQLRQKEKRKEVVEKTLLFLSLVCKISSWEIRVRICCLKVCLYLILKLLIVRNIRQLFLKIRIDQSYRFCFNIRLAYLYNILFQYAFVSTIDYCITFGRLYRLLNYIIW